MKMKMKIGDLIWRNRLPGGFCIYLGEELVSEVLWSQRAEKDSKELYYSVLHPVEGLVHEQSYHYETVKSYESSKSPPRVSR